MPYNDLFKESWRAFTDHPIKRLSDFDGKRVGVSSKVDFCKAFELCVMRNPDFPLHR